MHIDDIIVHYGFEKLTGKDGCDAYEQYLIAAVDELSTELKFS